MTYEPEMWTMNTEWNRTADYKEKHWRDYAKNNNETQENIHWIQNQMRIDIIKWRWAGHLARQEDGTKTAGLDEEESLEDDWGGIRQVLMMIINICTFRKRWFIINLLYYCMAVLNISHITIFKLDTFKTCETTVLCVQYNDTNEKYLWITFHKDKIQTK